MWVQRRPPGAALACIQTHVRGRANQLHSQGVRQHLRLVHQVLQQRAGRSTRQIEPGVATPCCCGAAQLVPGGPCGTFLQRVDVGTSFTAVLLIIHFFTVCLRRRV